MTSPGSPRLAGGAQPISAAPFELTIIGTAGLPARYGGFETLADELTSRLAARHRLCIYCTRKGRAEFPTSYRGATLAYLGLDANGWQSIPYDIVSLWRAAFVTRTVLVLGVSGCLFLPVLRLVAPRLRIVTNIDGLEWKRKKWGLLARAVLRASEWAAVRFSHEVIADNQGIQDHVMSSYGRSAHLIPYGGDNHRPARPSDVPRDTVFAPGSYFFGVCRIEPENNIHHMLAAFRQTPTRQLVLVGNWNISAYSRDLRTRHADAANIQLADPIYDQARLARLRIEAIAYIHGHSAGGTNPSLVEAMMAGAAVIAYDVNYNRYSTEGRARYWKTAADLARAVSSLTEQELREDAEAMREIARRRYTWETVSQKYKSLLFPSNGDL